MIGEELDTPPFDLERWQEVPWVRDLLPFPDDSAYPLLQSPPPSDAVGSYGVEAAKWILFEMGVRLRHWQKWALRLQLAHREDGSLCYRNIIESTPRRSGKSVRLRTTAVFRCAHPELFGEQQFILLAGKDSSIVLEHHRKTWRWAQEHGWALRRRTGAEEIEALDGSRFVVRGKDSCWGYDTCYGIVDEAHGVATSIVDDAIEPSLLERLSPQLHLVSTSSRNATSLMRKRIFNAIAHGYEDRDTLVMVWAAPPGARADDMEVWRAANPHWTREREAFMVSKLEQALAGQADPTADDPDPVSSFISQYLNGGWWWNPETVVAGELMVTESVWESLNGFDAEHLGSPVTVALESWFEEGCAAAATYRLEDGRVGISARAFPDLAAAAAWAGSQGAMSVLAGKNLLEDPAVVKIGAVGVGATSRQSVTEMKRLIEEQLIAHDNSPVLTDQVLAVRVQPGPEGLRLRSSSRLDGVKAAVWAVTQTRKGGGTPRIW